VEALIRAGDETSLPVLEKRLRDRYPGIRETAARAIDAIKRRTERER
jgi:HEAT repeat protein